MYKFTSRCILLNSDNEILFLQHNPNSQFSLPGGHFEEWEDPYIALEREIREELGFQIKILWKKLWIDKYENIQELPLPLYMQKISYLSPKHWQQKKFEYFFLAKVVSWNFKIQSEEIENYKRVDLDKFGNNSDLKLLSEELNIFENVVEVICKNFSLIKSFL